MEMFLKNANTISSLMETHRNTCDIKLAKDKDQNVTSEACGTSVWQDKYSKPKKKVVV